MARTHCGRKSGVLECMEQYPYWMLTVMIFFTGLLHYSVLHFNMLLTKLTSLFLDVPPLFMVMVLLIAAGGCTDPSRASPGSNIIMRSPTGGSDGKGSSSSFKESTAGMRRRRSSRSWPSWDWLQPYDPELFLRFERKEHCKEGSKGGETDHGRSSGITHGSRELKCRESSSSMEDTLHSGLPSQNQVTKCKAEDHDQLAMDLELKQNRAKLDVLLTDGAPKSEGAPKEDINRERCCTAFTVDTLNPAAIRGGNLPGYAGVGKFGRMHTDQLQEVELFVPLTGESLNSSLHSILGLQGDNILNSESSHIGCKVYVDPISQHLSLDASNIMIKPKDSTSSSVSVRFDPELHIRSSTKVRTEPDEHGGSNSEQESLNACSHDHQLISVGSLKDWDPFLQGDDEICQGLKDADDVVFPTTSHILSDSLPRIGKGADHIFPTSKAFSGVRENYSTPVEGTFREFNDSNKAANSSSSMSKISKVYSFKDMTMDEKSEEKLYWEVKHARPAEFDSWREALLWNSAHGEKLDSDLFQGIDGSPCLASAPNAQPVDDYKPSAPPFNPLLFYEPILPDEAADFFRSYEQFLIDAGNIFLFDSLKPMRPSLCGNCNCYASSFAEFTRNSSLVA